MAKNENLKKAKTEKNDEFYTRYQDISNELAHYRNHFKGKVVYCNCDDPSWSNFWKYFHNNFTSLGLKKLISTHYRKDDGLSYMMEYEGGDDFHTDVGTITEIAGNTVIKDNKEIRYTAGDFRSNDCIRLLEDADIVVTNPPFSLFREYIAQLMEYDKKFIIIGNPNAITYKEFFPLVKENRVWIGAKPWSSEMYFELPKKIADDLVKNKKEGSAYVIIDGQVLGRTSTIWFTNLDIKKRHDGLWHINGVFDDTQAHSYYEGNEHLYPKYDNYDAINVDKTSMIPIDYSGVMGVPITWLDKYNPDEFDIIELGNSRDNFTPNKTYENPKKHTKDGKTVNGGAINCVLALSYDKKPTGVVYYTSDNSNYLVPPYARILIKNKNPISRENDK